MCGIRGFARRIRKSPHPLAVDVAHRQKQDSANRESQHGAKRAAASQPIVHQDDPARADHGAEAQCEIIREA